MQDSLNVAITHPSVFLREFNVAINQLISLGGRFDRSGPKTSDKPQVFTIRSAQEAGSKLTVPGTEVR